MPNQRKSKAPAATRGLPNFSWPQYLALRLCAYEAVAQDADLHTRVLSLLSGRTDPQMRAALALRHREYARGISELVRIICERDGWDYEPVRPNEEFMAKVRGQYE
jgi:hypothetical protein